MNGPPPLPLREPADLVQYEKTLDCVHCGLCLPACPTYELFGREGTSPRGRIYLLRGLAEGAVVPGPEVLRDLDLCLVCRACEPVCPSGVRFGEIMELARSRMLEPARPPTAGTRLRRLALQRLLPYPRRLRALAWLIDAYQRLGVQGVLRRYGTLQYLSPVLALQDGLLPVLPRWRRRRRLPRFTRAAGERRGRVALLEGCVAPLLLGDVNRATIQALAGQGFDVVVPGTPTCCGALSAHFGAGDAAARAARRTLRAFQSVGPVDAVVVNSAGCGALMKEYGRLLGEGTADDATRASAHGFGERVRDVTEFLVARGIRPPAGRVHGRVAYADACHLAHAQGVRSAPRELLAAVPGVELVELPRADRCCGAAGLYNVLEPAASLALLEPRMNDLRATGADVLAVANPGCLLQWRSGVARAGLAVLVAHPVELLARATAPLH